MGILDVYPVSNVVRKIIKLKDGPTQVEGKIIETALLNLEVAKVYEVPEVRHPQGGDLSKFKDEVVLLTNDGEFYIASQDRVKRINLIAPYNGYNQYKATVDSRKNEGKTANPLNLHRLRYNGVLVVSNPNITKLLVSFVDWNDAIKCYRNVVAGVVIPDSLDSLENLHNQITWERVYESKPCLPIAESEADIHGHMSGGKIIDIGDSKFAIANGDFEWDGVALPASPFKNSNNPVSQDMNYDYGKVVEINWLTGSSKIISSGNRNMQGIAVGSDGSVFTAEHGPRGGDKINRHMPGSNFGWPLRTYGTQYNLMPWPNADPYGRMDGFDAPVFAYVPSVATSDLLLLQGFSDAWNGDLIVGSLKAASLFRIRLEGNRGVYSEPIYIGYRIRSVLQFNGKYIVLWTDENKLIFLRSIEGGGAIKPIFSEISESNLDERRKTKIKSAIESCLQCHSVDPANSLSAPTLAGIAGRKIASTSYPNYSVGLKGKNGEWSKSEFVKYVLSPSQFANGSTMPALGLDESVIEDVYSVFERASKRKIQY